MIWKVQQENVLKERNEMNKPVRNEDRKKFKVFVICDVNFEENVVLEIKLILSDNSEN